MKGIKLANVVLLVAGLGLTVLGVVLLLYDGVREREHESTPVSDALPSTDAEWLATGEKLVAEHNCNFCHRTEIPKDKNHVPRDNCQSCHQYSNRPENLAPPLDTIAERRPEPWLRRYLKFPYPIRENSSDRMPDMQLSDREVEVLTRYMLLNAADGIASLPSYAPAREARPDPERMNVGRQLWAKYECGTCHSLGEHKVTPQYDHEGNVKLMATVFAPRLDKAWTRTRPEALAAIIRHPAMRIPWANMLQKDISEREAMDLAWYIVNAVPAPKHTVSHNEVVDILRRRCNGCHYGPDPEASFNTNPEGGAGWLATWTARPIKLDLMSYEGLMKGAVDELGNRRAVVVPYARNSPLLMYVKGHKQPRMPFGADPLPEDEIDKIERWILSGAPGPGKDGEITVNPPIEFGD